MSPFNNINDALQSEIRFKLGEQDTVWVTKVQVHGTVELDLTGPVNGTKLDLLKQILGSQDMTLTAASFVCNDRCYIQAIFTGVNLEDYAEYFA